MVHSKKNSKDAPKPSEQQSTNGLPDQPSLTPWTIKPEDAAKASAPGETAPEAAPTAPAAEADPLAELKKKAAERDEYLDLLQRTRADYLNYMKRAQKERAETIKYGIQEFAGKVVAVMDDFARAIASAEKSKDFQAFFEGVKLIEAQFQKVLSNAGINPIEAVGKPFDPSRHEAVMQEERADLPEGTVLEELQRGFMLNDRVLRPARVKVSRKPEEKPAAPKEAEKSAP